jgi:transketolase
MMEGISHEVCSLAGVWKLSKLIAFYDDNGISIDGHVKGWFGDDTPKRFEAYGWNVIRDVDGHDIDAVDRAIAAAKAQNDKPTLICCKTIIGKGSPNKAGTRTTCTARRSARTKSPRRAPRWASPKARSRSPPTCAPNGTPATPAPSARPSGTRCSPPTAPRIPELAAEFERRMKGELPADFAAKAEAKRCKAIIAKAEVIATRKSSQNSIQALAPLVPEFVGGSADLAPSNLTTWKGCKQRARRKRWPKAATTSTTACASSAWPRS